MNPGTNSFPPTHDGERLAEDEASGNFREHLERYRFAARRIPPRAKVLDCACGTGYGTPWLAGREGWAVGVDLSPEAVDFARERYGSQRVEFRTGSAESLEFSDASFDAYCCFETLEHVPRPDRLLQEATRVLKAGGLFLASTPNRVLAGLASGEKPKNPHHLREWSLGEFRNLLEVWFRVLRLFGQHVKSRNKFRLPYLASKGRRLLGLPDFLEIPLEPQFLERFESPSHWQPRNFLALCLKPD